MKRILLLLALTAGVRAQDAIFEVAPPEVVASAVKAVGVLGKEVVISDKDDWTFIDGSGVTVNDLRSLFVNLPMNLELPPLEKRQIK